MRCLQYYNIYYLGTNYTLYKYYNTNCVYIYVRIKQDVLTD